MEKHTERKEPLEEGMVNFRSILTKTVSKAQFSCLGRSFYRQERTDVMQIDENNTALINMTFFILRELRDVMVMFL